ncbi:growth hormone secretagogue receptor type 1-like [Macrosteles quadrilineatus]|uniref:growth hormone secretagogue receptor type 1-like n=1 Tax=Macrosteles quadrilineatus TaxID=74068 RepID=UPI0023E11414|nr:growth hormone secretagogue receptor type 1-like [Macrosteles quadrilineatus]
MCFPILAVAEYSYAEYFDGSMVPVCLTQADTFWAAFFFLSTISLFFGLPLAILIILYSVIACHLMANPGIVAPSAHSALRYRRQVVMMLGTVVVSFFLCLLPFRAFTLWIILEPPEVVSSLGVDKYYNILYFSRIMLYLNSAVNPILYNLMSSKFRDGFRRLLGFKPIKRDPLNRKGTITTTTTTTVTNSSQKKMSADARSLKRSVVRVLSREDRKRSIDLGFTTKIKRLGQTKGYIKSDESFV